VEVPKEREKALAILPKNPCVGVLGQLCAAHISQDGWYGEITVQIVTDPQNEKDPKAKLRGLSVRISERDGSKKSRQSDKLI